MAFTDWWTWFWGIPPPPSPTSQPPPRAIHSDQASVVGNAEPYTVNILEQHTGEIFAADFETAIKEAGFGRFHVLLMSVTVVTGWASTFGITIMSYVAPVAYCDLNLSYSKISQLLAIPYIGVITSSLLWGYLSDTIGRKVIILASSFLNFIFLIISSLSQDFLTLILTQFFCGAIISGCHHIMLCYTSEFLSAKHRTKFILVQSALIVSAYLILPALCIGILPHQHTFLLFDYLEVDSWALLMLATTTPSLLAFIGIMFLPESPKFFMTHGNTDAALQSLKYIYTINKKKHKKEAYKVRSLSIAAFKLPKKEGSLSSYTSYVSRYSRTDVSSVHRKTAHEAFMGGKRQLKLLFSGYHLKHLVLITVISFLVMIGLHTFRSWLPTMFTKMREQNVESPNYCVAIKSVVYDTRADSPLHRGAAGFGNRKKRFPQKIHSTNRFMRALNRTDCYINEIKPTDYVSSMIINGFAVGCYLIPTILINYIERRLLLMSGISIAGMLGIILYLLKEGYDTYMGFAAVIVGFGFVSYTTVMTIVVDVFPTEVRTMAIAMVNMCGYMGPFLGNMLYPVLAEHVGCVAPFTLLSGTFMIAASFTFLLPKENVILID